MRKRLGMRMREQRRTSRVTLFNQISSSKYHQLYKLQTLKHTSIEFNMHAFEQLCCSKAYKVHSDLQKRMRDLASSLCLTVDITGRGKEIAV